MLTISIKEVRKINFSIGEKVKELRVKFGLTQEELASRTELSKGFISQLERDIASPSIATLVDILEALGTNIRDFFNETPEEKVVFSPQDIFIKEDSETGNEIRWLVTNSQKNLLEPILVTIQVGQSSVVHDPHEGEEFGYVLNGSAVLVLGTSRHKIKKGDSFYFKPSQVHFIENNSKFIANILWISTPPSF